MKTHLLALFLTTSAACAAHQFTNDPLELDYARIMSSTRTHAPRITIPNTPVRNTYSFQSFMQGIYTFIFGRETERNDSEAILSSRVEIFSLSHPDVVGSDEPLDAELGIGSNKDSVSPLFGDNDYEEMEKPVISKLKIKPNSRKVDEQNA